ncbi:MAG: ABC transporter permease [Chloroflexi bacterium]|nr:ABC transporter permease [Chloroflexota bacterium]MBM4452755.1 ABC transporter permease [Chloroflexota bacterium]
MTGLAAIFRKELADHFNSKRFIILFLLVYLAAIAATYVAAQNIRSGITENTQFIFLRLFIVSGETLPFSLPLFLSLFIPVVGIALGFDAVSGERASGTLSRLLAQPVYRDSVVNGKFLAGLATLSVLVMSIVALVAGMGLRMIGVPPNAEEILRIFGLVALSVVYGAFWMSLAVLFSVFFSRTATSALASIAIWIFLLLFMSMIARLIAGAVVPIDQNSTAEQVVRFEEVYRMISRISPNTLYAEAFAALMTPELGTLSVMLLQESIISGMVPTPLPLSQSLSLIWPQVTSLIALTALCFAISYIKFMREEIRST